MRYEIGEKISYFRKKYRITQNDLAKKVGCSRVNISLIENGHSYPSFDLLFRISIFFDIETRELIPEKRELG